MTYISAAELARRLEVSREAVSQAIKNGRIKSYRKNGRSIQCHAVKAAAEFNNEVLPVSSTPKAIEIPAATTNQQVTSLLCWGSEQSSSPTATAPAKSDGEESQFSSELQQYIQGLPEDAIPEPSISRSRREYYQAELAKVQALHARREVGSIADMKREAFSLAKAVREGMLAIVPRISADLAALADPFEIEQRLEAEVLTALRVLADG